MHNKVTPFWYLGLLSAFSLISFDLYQPALPAITSYFNTSHALGQLTLSLFFFVFGLAQLIWGPLIDHFGRKKPLAISLLIFLVATLFCIFASNIETLIAARVIQGFAVCCANVVAFASSRDKEDSTERARVLSHISMIVSISPIFAPLIGSIVFIHFGWQATFVVMALIGVILLALAGLILFESPHWTKSSEFFLLQTSLKNYKELITHQRLLVGAFLVTTSFSCVMIIIVNAAYLIIDNLHISPLYFSFFFALNGLTIIFGNYLGIKLREIKSLQWNIRLGTLLMILGSFMMLFYYYFIGFNLMCLAPALLVSLGVSLSNPPTFSLALSDYKTRAATATAILHTSRMTIAAIISAVVATLLAHHLEWLPLSLSICSLSCFVGSFFIKEEIS